MMIKKLLIEALKIFAITSILWALIKLIQWRPYLGFTVIAVLGFLIIAVGILLNYGKKHTKKNIMNENQQLPSGQSIKQIIDSHKDTDSHKDIDRYKYEEPIIGPVSAEDVLSWVNNFIFAASIFAGIVLLAGDIVSGQGIFIIIGAWISEVIFWLGIKVFIKMSGNIEQINKKLK